jgi:hypothetical protein
VRFPLETLTFQLRPGELGGASCKWPLKAEISRNWPNLKQEKDSILFEPDHPSQILERKGARPSFEIAICACLFNQGTTHILDWTGHGRGLISVKMSGDDVSII